MIHCHTSSAPHECCTASACTGEGFDPQFVRFQDREGYQQLQALADLIASIPEDVQSSSMREFMRLFLSFQQDLNRACTQSMLNALEAKYNALLRAADEIMNEANDQMQAAVTSATVSMTVAGVQMGVASVSCMRNQQATDANARAGRHSEAARRHESDAAQPRPAWQSREAHAQQRAEFRDRASASREFAASCRGSASRYSAQATKLDLYAHAVRTGGQALADMSQVNHNMAAAEERRDQNTEQAKATQADALLGTISQTQQSSEQASSAATQTLMAYLNDEAAAARAAATTG